MGLWSDEARNKTPEHEFLSEDIESKTPRLKGRCVVKFQVDIIEAPKTALGRVQLFPSDLLQYGAKESRRWGISAYMLICKMKRKGF